MNDAVGLELVEESGVAVAVLVAGVRDQEDVAKAATACVWARCGSDDVARTGCASERVRAGGTPAGKTQVAVLPSIPVACTT